MGKKILVSFVAVVVAISFTYLWFDNVVIYSVEEIDMHLKVVKGRIAGVNIDTDALYFGMIGQGGLSARTILLDNYDNRSHLVQIRTLGELSEWVYVSDNNLIIEPNERKNVSVSCDIPRDAEVGNYTGKLQAVYFNIWDWV